MGVVLVAALLKLPRIEKIFVTGQRPYSDTALRRMVEQTGNESAIARVKYSAGDTGDADIVSKQWAEAVEFFGGVPPTALFINAGIGGGRYLLEDFDIDRFDAMFRTNVRGVFLWLRAALPSLKAADSTSQIVVTSSVAGSRAFAQGGPYCASKHAVNGLVLSLRQELKVAQSRVKVGLISPGPIATAWWDDPARGFGAPDTAPPPPKMLTAEAVAAACVSMMEQGDSSNMEEITLDPA